MAELIETINSGFSQYAGAVLQSRALVDVRDGLKPSARQIFYCMDKYKYTADKPYQKTMASIGDALKHFYIHGDSSCEGVIMRAGQGFAMRYPLVEVKGNGGTLLSSGNWAAPRYTESRLSKTSKYLFADIDKDTVDEWRDNYSETEQYPSVVPTKGYYNLVNGSMGIGIGMACSIPQFNIRELNSALIYLIDHPDCDFEKIYCAPDFATGAILLNEKEVKESLKNGTGAACKLRSKVDFDAVERCFVVTEIPYSVYTNTICEELEAIIESEDNPGIDRFNDLTGSKPLIKIYLTKTAEPGKILKFLYKNTSLQYYYSVNMTMLDKGRFPKVFGWKDALQSHIDHEKEVYRRGFEFDLRKIADRIHIIDGLLICLASIDEVVRTIKSSESTADASNALQKNFLLDAVQAKAVLDMKLSRLAHLEVQKLEDEKTELQKEEKRLTDILHNEVLFNEQVKKGWLSTISAIGDSRRTVVMNISSANEEEEAEENDLYILDTAGQLISVNPAEAVALFKKNGPYAKNVPQVCECNHGHKVYVLNESGTTTDTRVTEHASLFIMDDSKDYVVTVSKHGLMKKSEISEYKKNGSLCKVKDGDSIIAGFCCNDSDYVMIWTEGKINRISVSAIKVTGRATMGTKQSSSPVLGAWLSTQYYYTVNEKGQYKRALSADVKSNVMLNDGCNMVGPCTEGTAFMMHSGKFRELDWSTVTVHGRTCDGARLSSRNFKNEI